MSSAPEVIVSWDPPPPRRGLLGSWDRFVGPHALKSENWLTIVSSVVVSILAVWRQIEAGDGRSAWETVLLAIIAFDIAGGVVANATGTAKRWYHRSGRTNLHHLGFVAIHSGHVALIAGLFADEPWAFLVAGYGGLLISASAVVAVPHHLERPVAMGLVAVATMASTFDLVRAPGVEWFLPLVFLKLLVGHLVKEAPFLPETPRG